MPAPFRVGLTGGLASGKSTVARLLAEAGFPVVDADRVVGELYRPGGAGTRALTTLFGPGLLKADGSVDKAGVAHLIFSDSVARLALEEAIHPLVRARFASVAATATGPVVFEATRLVEAGYAPDFDLVVTVEAPLEVRLERAVARGLPREEALSRLVAQGDGRERRAAADRTIVNDGTPEELRAAVAALVAEIRQRSIG